MFRVCSCNNTDRLPRPNPSPRLFSLLSSACEVSASSLNRITFDFIRDFAFSVSISLTPSAEIRTVSESNTADVFDCSSLAVRFFRPCKPT
ncbi:unnamed protein product [Brugia timori]|uniref:Uncharacterized protein n=1 Tax=Brugia timori TaxID=42155 RepID=A0A3P7WEG6_9BILA|nr:unnamed protein product [Brugia timori]